MQDWQAEMKGLLHSDIKWRGLPIAMFAGMTPDTTIVNAQKSSTRAEATRTKMRWATTVGRAIAICAIAATAICGGQPDCVTDFEYECLPLETDAFGAFPTDVRDVGFLNLHGKYCTTTINLNWRGV